MSRRHEVKPARVVLAITGLLTAAAALGQGQNGAMAAAGAASKPAYVPTMTFDVVSVRESRPDPNGPFSVGGGFQGDTSSLEMENNNLANLLGMAYSVDWYQMEGVPAWAQRPMYNVKAKGDEETDRKLARLPRDEAWSEKQHMLQAMLADRFHLRVHRETREGRVYRLVVAKGGIKMPLKGSLPVSAQERKNFSNETMPEIYQQGDGRLGYVFIAHGCHMPALAEVLKSMMSAEVVDATGLTGAYDFRLQYSQADDAERERRPEVWPAMPQAVQEQLGLRLEPAKGLVRVLVVDHVEPPTAN